MSVLLTSFLSSIIMSPATLGPLFNQGSTGMEHQLEHSFQSFMIRFQKYYDPGSPEYSHRLRIFHNSLRRIERLNQHRNHQSNSPTTGQSALYGITPFSDLTPEEFRHRYLTSGSRCIECSRHHRRKYGDQLESPSRNRRSLFTFGNSYFYGSALAKEREDDASVPNRIGSKYWRMKDVPSKVDWRESGVVSSVRNQKKCGACWAFSTIETIESMNAIKNNNSLTELSVQQVVDCAGSDPSSGNHGCDGGDTCSALSWMWSRKVKLLKESEYPLRDDSGSCLVPFPDHGVVVKNFTCEDFVRNEEEMVRRLAHHGPLTVAVDATSWQDYLGGIIQFHCESSRNHAVQIVGYDLTGDVPYFIVRNTWGPEFGIDGYLHIAIGNNMCGIAEEVSSVVV